MNNKRFYFSKLLRIILNKSNMNKMLIIFILGFITRIFINYIYNVNIFRDYLDTISIIYNILIHIHIVLIYDIISHFNFNVFSYICNILSYIIKNLSFMNKRIFLYKLEDIKISSILEGAKYFFNRDKVIMYMNDSSTSNLTEEKGKKTKILDSESIKKNSYISEKSRGYAERRVRRLEEIRLRREQADRIARERVQLSSTSNTNYRLDIEERISQAQTRNVYNSIPNPPRGIARNRIITNLPRLSNLSLNFSLGTALDRGILLAPLSNISTNPNTTLILEPRDPRVNTNPENYSINRNNSNNNGNNNYPNNNASQDNTNNYYNNNNASQDNANNNNYNASQDNANNYNQNRTNN